jgi:hypothetical protein
MWALPLSTFIVAEARLSIQMPQQKWSNTVAPHRYWVGNSAILCGVEHNLPRISPHHSSNQLKFRGSTTKFAFLSTPKYKLQPQLTHGPVTSTPNNLKKLEARTSREMHTRIH